MDRKNEWISNNGDTIKIDKKGLLIDGQHRLKAIIIHAKPLTLWVAQNVEKRSIMVIDIGRRRSPGDTLSLQGEKDCNVLASVLRMLNSYMEKNLATLSCNKAYISPTETEALLHKNPDISGSF